jgi:hypothetical protein
MKALWNNFPAQIETGNSECDTLQSITNILLCGTMLGRADFEAPGVSSTSMFIVRVLKY